MFYYLKDGEDVRSLCAADTAEWLQAWDGYDNNVALPFIQADFICWSRPFNPHVKIYAFDRELNELELADL